MLVVYIKAAFFEVSTIPFLPFFGFSSVVAIMADTISQKTRTSGDEDIIVFSFNDPDDPRNWSKSKKRRVIALMCILAFVGIFGSSSYVS